MFAKGFSPILVWWKLVLVQILGVAIIFLIPKVGVDQQIISLVGSHSDISGYILIIFIILPGLIAWIRKVKRWWIPFTLTMLPIITSFLGLCKMIYYCYFAY